MIRILLVDDQNLVRQGIKSLLDRDPEIEVIGTVTDGRSAVTQISKLRPDVVLLDIEMPGMNGITVTKYITHLAPETKVIILSSHEEKKYLTQALMAGAKAYVLKSSLMTDLRQSIVAVNSGYSHIESRLLAKIFDPSNFKLSDSKKLSNSKKTASYSSKSSPARKHKSVVNTSVTAKSENAVAESVSILAHQSPSSNLPDAAAVNSSALTMQDKDIMPATASNKIDKTVPKIKLAYADNIEPAESIPQDDRLLPAPIVHNSASQLSSSIGSRYYRTFRVAVNEKGYVHKLKTRSNFIKNQARLKQFWQEKIVVPCQPIIDRSRSQVARSRQRMMPLLREWHQKGWLANLGLGIVGLVAVIIIQQMFS